MFTFGSPSLRHLTLILLFSGLTADVSVAAKPTPIPRAMPVEKEKKPGFLGRIFTKKPTPAPEVAPAPAATVAPTPRARPKKKRAAAPQAKPEAQPDATPESTPPTGETPTATPNPGLAPLPDVPDLGIIDVVDDADPNVALPALPTTSAPAPAPAPVSGQLPASLPPLVGGAVDDTEDEELGAPALPAATPAAPRAALAKDVAPPVAMATPIPLEIRNNPMNQPIPLIDSSMALQITAEPVEPEISPEQEAAQRLQFQNTKAKALEDAKLQQLKQKTETAASPAERYAALKEYYPQLFERMRKIDGTLEVQIDEMEAAARRRLERMQAGDVPKTSSR
ncbi:MAG TPA: hypothetical protein VF585_10770 [Chthoniobacterales bacterium]